MKIAILLPQKEKYTAEKAGSVSIFVNNHLSKSTFKNDTKIYGAAIKNSLDVKNFVSIKSNKKIFTNRSYVNNFSEKINIKVDLIELHNRPKYFYFLKKNFPNKKFIIYFHNDPNDLDGARTVEEKIYILSKCDKIIFLSKWIKEKFIENLEDKSSSKYEIFYPGVLEGKKFNTKKEKIILFVGKLNKDKGYDIFIDAVSKFVKKNIDWRAISIGSEDRRTISKNKYVKELGELKNIDVLKLYERSSIAIANSTRNEPLGRLPIEASSRGCLPIVSNSGGLPESVFLEDFVLKQNSANSLYSKIKKITSNLNLLKKNQKKVFDNFKLKLKSQSIKLDNLRNLIFFNQSKPLKIKNLKILHITNFNERFDGRLHYNTGKRINNGFIREGFNVLSLSDRDLLSQNKNILDISGAKNLNKKITNIVTNFKPNLIALGHADSVSLGSLEEIKNIYPEIKIIQWFLDPLSSHGPDYKKNKKRILKFAKIVDATFLTTDPKSLNFKIENSYYIPNPCDKCFETLRVFKNKTKNDVFFALSHGVHRGKLKPGKKDDREIFFELLKKSCKNVLFDLYGMNSREPIWGQEFLNAINNSSMAVNLSRGKPIKYYSSDRISQLVGNGLLTFIHKDVHYSDFFKSNEIIFYKNLKDLAIKLIFYKKNEKLRKKIAYNGWKKYHSFMNSNIVARYMIDKSFLKKYKYKYIWETS
jgi:glycosyltransferase involved in cell wall biosynthesis